MQEENEDKERECEIRLNKLESINGNVPKNDISPQNNMDKQCGCGKEACSCISEDNKHDTIICLCDRKGRISFS